MSMNNIPKAGGGGGFKMKPGSKNLANPSTFRGDSPLKQLGFTPQDGGESPMRSNGKYKSVHLGDSKRRKTKHSSKGVGDEKDTYYERGGDIKDHGTAIGHRKGVGRISKNTKKVTTHRFSPGEKGANKHGMVPVWKKKKGSDRVAGSAGWRTLKDGTKVVKEKGASAIKPKKGKSKNARKMGGSLKGLKRR